jgi:hypothetical protein
VVLLEARATDFGFWYPRTFKNHSLNPKFHVMVTHMHQYARAMASKGISPGMTNEQSIEAVHVKYNDLARRMRNAVNDAMKLKRMMSQREVAVNPLVHSEARYEKNRQKN